MAFVNTVDSIGDVALTNSIIDRSITSIADNIVTAIGKYAFYKCSNLSTADFVAVTSIESVSFQDCSALTSLILRSETMCTLADRNAFTNTPIASGDGYIYVPAALVDSYKAASGWSTYAAQIRAIEDWPSVCDYKGKVWGVVRTVSSYQYYHQVIQYVHDRFILITTSAIYYSTDGQQWLYVNAGISSPRSIAYSNGLFVASGGGDGLTYSTDFKTWNKCTGQSVISALYNSVAYANGIWVAGCLNNGLYYSNDGVNWTQSNVASFRVKQITYINGIWIATCDGDSYTSYSSTDGMTWTQSNVTGTNLYSYDVVYVDGLFVMAGTKTLYSTDGMTWTENDTIGSTRSIKYANGIWVAGGNGNGLHYSTNGMTWVQSNITTGSGPSIAYSDGLWVAATNTGLLYSTDGMTWVQSNISSETYKSIVYANGVWLACSSTNVCRSD